MKLVYRALDMKEANWIAHVIRSRGIKCKILGKLLYGSILPTTNYGGHAPLSVWIMNNDQYRNAIRAIWAADAHEGARRVRDSYWARLSGRKKFLFVFGFVFVVAIISGSSL